MSSRVFFQALEEIKAGLKAEKVAGHKEALKKLDAALDSDDFLQQLDQETARLGPASPVTGMLSIHFYVANPWAILTYSFAVPSWPGLASLLVKFISEELQAQASKKRGPDAIISKTFRKVISLADDERRSGHKAVLRRRAPQIFLHVFEVLKHDFSSTSQINQDYTAVLRNHLLTVPAYTLVSSSQTFQGLLDLYMRKVESSLRVSRSTDECHRNMQTLTALLNAFSSDMSPEFQNDMLAFFIDISGNLGNLKDGARLLATTLLAVNSFLLLNGVDVVSQCVSGLPMAWHPIIMRGLKSRDSRLSDAAIVYVRICCALDIFACCPDSRPLDELLQWADSHLSPLGFVWAELGRDGSFKVTKQQPLLAMVAALYNQSIIKSKHTSDGTARTEDLPPPQKKRRAIPRLSILRESVRLRASIWAPVASQLLLQYAEFFPGDVLPGWLEDVSTKSQLGCLGHYNDQTEAALWVLRYIQSLALAWPHNSTDNPVHVMTEAWEQIWHTVLGMTKQHDIPTFLFETALSVLSAIITKKLIPTPPGLNSFWNIPILTKDSASGPLVDFIACASMSGHDIKSAGTIPVESIAQWIAVGVVEGSLTNVDIASSAYLALLGFESNERNSKTMSMVSSPWWQIDDLQDLLRPLTRGESLFVKMRCRPIHVSACTQAALATSPDPVWSSLCNALSLLVQAAMNGATMGHQNGSPLPSANSHFCQIGYLVQVLLLVVTSVEKSYIDFEQHEEFRSVELRSWFEPAAQSIHPVLERALDYCSQFLEKALSSREGFSESDMRLVESVSDLLLLHSKLAQRCGLSAETLVASYVECMNAAHMLFISSENKICDVGGNTLKEIDDDFDVEFRIQRPSKKTTVSLGSIIAWRERCIWLLRTLAPLQPENGAKAAVTWLCHDANIPLEEEQYLQLLETLFRCAATSLHPQLVSEAFQQIEGDQGILFWEEKTRSRASVNRLQFVVEKCIRPISTAIASVATDDTSLRPVAEKCANLVCKCICRYSEAESELNKRLSTWRLRVVCAEITAELFRADPQLFPGDLLGVASTAIMSLINDEKYLARLVGGRLVQTLFARFSNPLGIFEDAKNRLCLQSIEVQERLQMQEHMETSIVMLAEVAIHCGPLEEECLLRMLAHAAMFQDINLRRQHVGLVAAALEVIAQALSYPDRYAYIAWHQSSILYQLLALKFGIQHIQTLRLLLAPSAAAAVTDRAFLNAVTPKLLAFFVFFNDEGALQELAHALGQSPEELLKAHIGHIMAISFPLTTTGNQHDSATAERIFSSNCILEKHVSQAELTELLTDSCMDVVGYMISSAVENPLGSHEHEPSFPTFSPQTIRAAVEKYATVMGIKDQGIAELLTAQRAMPKLLLMVHSHLQMAMHPRHVVRALPALETTLQVAGDTVISPSSFRYAVSILVRMMDVSEAQHNVCGMLEKLVDTLLREYIDTEIESLGVMLPTIISTLTQNIGRRRSALRSDPGKSLVGLLNKLTVQAPEGLMPYLKEVDPLVDFIPEIAEAKKCIDTARNNMSAVQQLIAFTKRVSSLTPPLRKQSLGALHGAISEHQSALYKESFCKAEVVECAWKLAVLSSDLADEDIASFAGELLALVGPLHPSIIAFNATSAPIILHQGTPLPASLEKSAHRAERSFWLAALKQLSDFLIDENVAVIKCAQYTLKHLLAAREIRAVLQYLPTDTRRYIEVFVPLLSATYSDHVSDGHISIELLTREELWKCDRVPYERWACRLAGAVLKHSQSPALIVCQRIAKLKLAFAEMILPMALVDLACDCSLRAENAQACEQLGAAINEYMLPRCHRHPKAMRLLLSCLNALRHRHIDSWLARNKKEVVPVLEWEYVFWLHLDYLDVAEAAIKSRAFFSAVMYIEYWWSKHRPRTTLSAHPKANQSSAQHHATNQRINKLLMEVYSFINEPDSIYAVTQAQDLMSQLKRYEHEGEWGHVALSYDLILRLLHQREGSSLKIKDGVDEASAEQGLLQSLRRMGMEHLVRTVMQYGSSATNVCGESAASSLGCWSQTGDLSTDFENGLQALQSGNTLRCRNTINSKRTGLVAGLVTASLETAADVNPALVDLESLQAVSELWEFKWPTLPSLGAIGSPMKRGRSATPQTKDCEGSKDVQFMRVLKGWIERETWTGAGGRYDLVSPLQKAHLELLDVVSDHELKAQAYLRIAVSARKAGRYAQAVSTLYQLETLLHKEKHTRWAQHMLTASSGWRVEQAKLLWAQSHKDTALSLVRNLLADCSADISIEKSYLQCLTAKWLSKMRSESSDVIIELFKEAVEGASNIPIDDSTKHAIVACRSLYRLAHYADTQYRNILANKDSPEFKTSQAVIAAKHQQLTEAQAEFELLKKAGQAKRNKEGQFINPRAMQLYVQMDRLRKYISHDEEEFAQLEQREPKVLEIALKSYSRCLLAGDGYDLHSLFRLIQLWFQLSTDESVNEVMLECLDLVPSHKFIPLNYQITSRLSSSSRGSFQGILSALVVRLAQDHPHHTLLHLFSLLNKDRDHTGMVRDEADGKVGSAVTCLDIIRRRGHKLKLIVSELENLVEGYIELAAIPHAKSDPSKVPFPAALRRSRHHCTHVPVLSATIAVDPTCRYEDIPTFVQFGENIKYVGGINAPKLISAVDSQGHCHMELVKGGNDDLRQDAVMQQFFGLVNRYLEEKQGSRKRGLHIRRYHVVPFSPHAGVLQWVENTVPIKDYLCGPNHTTGAISRYNSTVPGSLTFLEAFQEYTAIQKANKGLSSQTDAFERLCSRFSPAMHHFFLERFRDPGSWFERRLAFTRSIAVNSMAGYIVGLGDRHLSNILIDQKTAEVVHIDFGIAFEQGRFLHTPELIPFRLTQNIIDGMGPAGIEGPLRRCCEETLRVLRDEKESLLTVVEVFIHDPLYKWKLTDEQAARRQADEEFEQSGTLLQNEVAGQSALGNVDAERTIVRVKRKLEGVSASEGEGRGVEGQVQELLQQAMASDRLCRLYVGWAPFL